MIPRITSSISTIIKEPARERPSDYLTDWQEREALAESMVPIIGELHRKGVQINIYNRSLVNRSSIEIMKMHRFVRQIENNELSEFESSIFLELIRKLPLRPSTIDLGTLTVCHMNLPQEQAQDAEPWLREQLQEILNGGKAADEPRDVVIFGFGRIGRLLARLLIEEGGTQLRLRAVGVRMNDDEADLIKRASLLRRDSVHGSFRGTIRIDEQLNSLVVNGNPVRFIDVSAGPAAVDYSEYGIKNALLIDSSGAWRDAEGLGQHLQCAGISKVLLTAPGQGDLKNLVYGINHDQIESGDAIISAASCTTNAIVPILKIINDEYDVKFGHIETVHAYTNDQNLTDNYHPKTRRGRSAPMNMVITETGAAKAVAKALPELHGRITGNAIRVPTPNVSLAILNLQLGREVTAAQVNEHLREMALHSKYSSILDYTSSPDAASTDFVGSTYAVAVDSKATIAQGRNCVIYAWYDNEYGYCWQLFRLAQALLGVERPSVPRLQS